MSDRELEIWASIKNYEDVYEVSSWRNVRRLEGVNNVKGRILKNQKDKDGYICVALCKNGIRKTKKVHRLVGELFVPNPLLLKEINHKYGDKKNNYYKDLEWCSHRYNTIHALNTGLKPRSTEKQKEAIRKFNQSKKGMKYKTNQK